MKQKLYFAIIIIAYLLFASIGQPLANTFQEDINIVIFDKDCSVYYLESDVDPILKENRTLVPLRAIAETFGFSVSWNDLEQSAIVSKDDRQITLEIGSTRANVNGETVEIPVAPELLQNRMIVPLRYVCEFFEIKVEWSETGYIWLSYFELLPEEDITPDDGYYKPYSDIPYYVLNIGEKTHRGIEIGDDYEKVIAKYGKPHKITEKNRSKYIKYYTPCIPNSEVSTLNFDFEDGKVKFVAIEY